MQSLCDVMVNVLCVFYMHGMREIAGVKRLRVKIVYYGIIADRYGEESVCARISCRLEKSRFTRASGWSCAAHGALENA